ncbi:MAG: ATP-dependent sacrificial sulfur transferase LarE [Thermodesulfobacteriota bacterium]
MTHLSLTEKQQHLKQYLQRYPSMVIAFSGGVDSTFLLAAARQYLGENVMAVTAVSALQPRSEMNEAVKLVQRLDVDHQTVNTKELEVPEFRANTADRCYTCKRIIFSEVQALADRYGFAATAHGVNVDDLADYRPGLQAADEMGFVAPLMEAQMTKADIRKLSREMELPNWDKPAAACLASRIPYGRPITVDALEMIESAENVLAALGFHGFRVRHFGDTAKIEVRPAEFSRLLKPDRRLRIIEELRRIGFLYITMDLEGYQTGRLNRSVSQDFRP